MGPGLMSKRGSKRRVWSADEKRMICRQARLPGISVSQVARRYDVNANLVFTWLRDARYAPEDVEPPIEALAAEAPPGPSLFLPVELVEEAVETPSSDASPEPATGAAPSGTLEIALVGGHRLRVEGPYDPHALARLVRALLESAP